MEQELTPADLAAQRFRQVFRGYDPEEVNAHLATVAQQVQDLTAQRDRLAGRLGEFAERDLQSEFAALGQEVAAVLESARSAAEAMRERAATDAARWRSEALAEADAERKAARADAEHLRGDAWTTAEELLRQVQVESRRLRESAERDSLTVLGEAEREAHRLTAGARREAEDLMRSTRMEAERLNAEAKARHDEIIDQARRQAEAAQERARALEQRRQELLTELETLRSTLSRMEGELDERRTRLGLSAANEAIEDERSSVRVVRGEDAEEHNWELGETVRVVPARRRDTAEVEPEELVAEVRRLREGSRPPVASSVAEAGSELSTETVPGPPSALPEAAPSIEEPEPTAPPIEEPETTAPSPPEPATTPTSVSAPEPPPPDEVADIFRRLRGEDPVPVESPLPGGTSLAASVPLAGEPAPAAAETRTLTMADPFELRDRLLLPVTNRALRNIKRQLTELQNLALEELRVSSGSWRPPDDGFVEQLRPDLVVLTAEAFSMGHTAAEELAGQTMARPPTPSRNEAADFSRQLVDQLRGVMEGLSDESGRELSSAVSRVFRVWRTDEAERKVSDLAATAFHQGLESTLLRAGWGRSFVLSGRGCVRCREAVEDPAAAPLPPLHPGCTCTVVPIPG